MAGFDAGPHLDVFGKTGAVRCATFADFGACLTHEVVLVGAAKHHVCARLADLHTVRYQPYMPLLSVVTAYSQAMMDGYQADIMTCLAIGDAILHVPPLLGG